MASISLNEPFLCQITEIILVSYRKFHGLWFEFYRLLYIGDTCVHITVTGGRRELWGRNWRQIIDSKQLGNWAGQTMKQTGSSF